MKFRVSVSGLFYPDLEQVPSNDERATRIVLYWTRKESPI